MSNPGLKNGFEGFLIRMIDGEPKVLRNPTPKILPRSGMARSLVVLLINLHRTVLVFSKKRLNVYVITAKDRFY